MPEMPRPTLSSDIFKRWIVDRERSEIRLLLQDGREIAGPLSADYLSTSSQVSKFSFDWDARRVENLTTRGDLVVAEAYSPSAQAPLRGRKTVYLDQNHWSTLGAALTTPERVSNREEFNAALELARFIESGGIVAPVSAAHLRETAALYGDKRYQVGIAMARLSGGWQLRHPNHVWRNEVVRTIASEFGIEAPRLFSLPVVTLEPHAILDDDVHAYELPDDHADLFSLALHGPSILLELLIDPARTPPAPISEWVDRQVEITREITSGHLNATQKRLAAYAMLWSDNSEPVHAALAELETDLSLLAHLTSDDVPRLYQREPMLGYFSRLMTQRLINKSTQWRANDLTDMMFLAAATGYMDYVAAEKHTGTQLQQIQRASGKKVTVSVSLRDLVTQIKRDEVAAIIEGIHPNTQIR